MKTLALILLVTLSACGGSNTNTGTRVSSEKEQADANDKARVAGISKQLSVAHDYKFVVKDDSDIEQARLIIKPGGQFDLRVITRSRIIEETGFFDISSEAPFFDLTYKDKIKISFMTRHNQGESQCVHVVQFYPKEEQTKAFRPMMICDSQPKL